MRRKILTIFLSLVLLLSFSFQGEAKEFTSQRNGLDVMFAIDSSGSMVSNDPGRVGLSMVKALIDTVHIENIRIGFTAYSDRIWSACSPVPIEEASAREELKRSLDQIPYSGDTDMGLGIKTALEAMQEEAGRNRVLVVISDGETDLPQSSQRTEEQSMEDLRQCAQFCRDQQIPVYAIAFGQYSGSRDSLFDLVFQTGGESFQVSEPENLIEILYGIFSDRLSYKIQLLSSGVYGQGTQEIRVTLDEPYLDEMDLLLISSGPVQTASLQYKEQQIPIALSGNYGVGKIGYGELDGTVKEMALTASTFQDQSLSLYLVSYRQLQPVFSIEEQASRNVPVPYEVYLKDRQGQVISDGSFYSRFQWELQVEGDGVAVSQKQEVLENGILQGKIQIGQSGIYHLMGSLSDPLGSYPFEAELTITNSPPTGSLPEIRLRPMGGETIYHLDEYFQDADGDPLTYSLETGTEEKAAGIRLEGSDLTIRPLAGGREEFTLLVSDGEDTLSCSVQVRTAGLWETFGWTLAPAALILALLLFKLLHRPKSQVEVIAQKKRSNRFAGKMDAYVTVQPEGTEEIPPLTFPMYKIRESQVCLGDLMKEYPQLTDALRLDLIYLIADEDRRIILYHTSPSTIMTGSSILCRQIQYSLGFGDVLYITSPDGAYELELHYIAVIQ